MAGDDELVGADELAVGDVEDVVLHKRTDDEAVRAADDIDLEVVRLQVFDHLYHGPVEGLALGHAGVRGHRELLEGRYIGVELVDRHAREG